ncbi:LysR family transcriptional regulator [Burkholderia sp. MS455]|uniref:LysR family transcriptional regulator n=1 Tax=Burkholderia sp. MS455 TaxID=2811788 RepID=UPI001958188D|nr:LysR family transcriptional regulator [Burkholderia sp. MS455]QRR07525.1 LysR family transcriptional regulator [Burkholderia sp. MS455]
MRVFAHVAEMASFREAGRILGMSPTRVSRAISQLEACLNVRLAIRSTRRVQLTPAGERYLRRCQQILTAIRNAEAEVRRGNPDLRVGCPVGFGRHLLMPAVARIRNWSPTVIELSMHPFQTEMSVEGDFPLDMLITVRPSTRRLSLAIGTEWETRLIGEIPLVMCAAPDYLAQHGIPTRISELERHRCLGLSLPEVTNARCEEGDDAERIRGHMHINDEDAVADGVRAQMGIGIVPLYCVSQDCRTGSLVRLMPEYAMPSWIVEVHLAPISLRDPTIRMWVDLLCEDLKSQLVQDSACQ